MRYWQITTRRLSRAAAKLRMDDAWHAWQAAPLSWYRVWKKKMVQRITFETSAEEAIVFPLLGAFEPLPDVSGTAGFREEVWIVVEDDRFSLRVPLGYRFSEVEKQQAFDRPLAQFGMSTGVEQSLVYVNVPIEQFDRTSIIASQTLARGARLFFQGLTAATTSRQIEGAAEVFTRHCQLALDEGPFL
jgi:hypothetical protein